MEWTGEKVPGSFFASEIFNFFACMLDDWAKSISDMFKYYGGDSLLTKSHGQCHMAYFQNRYRIEGIYFLDEPENALSPKRQIEMLRLLRAVSTAGKTQFIIATHSPILLAYPEAEIFSFDGMAIEKISYEETDYFRLYREFLNDRRRFLD